MTCKPIQIIIVIVSMFSDSVLNIQKTTLFLRLKIAPLPHLNNLMATLIIGFFFLPSLLLKDSRKPVG